MLINDEERKKAIIRALLDEHSRRILSSTIWKAKSVMDLMREHGIPMTSAYRRVKELIECGLIKVEQSVVTSEGKKYDRYRSTVRNIDIHFREGSIEVEVSPSVTPADKLMDRFFSFKEVK